VRRYIQDTRLDEVVTGVLNGVMQKMPQDPFGMVAVELAKHCSASPRFYAFRYDCARQVGSSVSILLSTCEGLSFKFTGCRWRVS